jgi:hypothetical protein
MSNITKTKLLDFLPTFDAVGFDAFCDKNKISSTWLDVTLTNFNDGYYNVQLPDYGLEISYYDGEFEECIELEEA